MRPRIFSRSFMIRGFSQVSGALGFMRFPKFFKGLRCHGRQIASSRPAPGRVQRRSLDERIKLLEESPCPLCKSIKHRMVHHQRVKLEYPLFGEGRLLYGSVAAILEQVMVKIDFDGTGLRA